MTPPGGPRFAGKRCTLGVFFNQTPLIDYQFPQPLMILIGDTPDDGMNTVSLQLFYYGDMAAQQWSQAGLQGTGRDLAKHTITYAPIGGVLLLAATSGSDLSPQRCELGVDSGIAVQARGAYHPQRQKIAFCFDAKGRGQASVEAISAESQVPRTPAGRQPSRGHRPALMIIGSLRQARQPLTGAFEARNRWCGTPLHCIRKRCAILRSCFRKERQKQALTVFDGVRLETGGFDEVTLIWMGAM